MQKLVGKSRFNKAQVIAASRIILPRHGEPGWYSVESESVDGKFYRTSMTQGCSCPDYQRHKEECKHQMAVMLKYAAKALAVLAS